MVIFSSPKARDIDQELPINVNSKFITPISIAVVEGKMQFDDLVTKFISKSNFDPANDANIRTGVPYPTAYVSRGKVPLCPIGPYGRQ